MIKKYNKGELSFGAEILIFIVILFIIWAISKKPSENVNKPFIKEQTVNVLPQ